MKTNKPNFYSRHGDAVRAAAARMLAGDPEWVERFVEHAFVAVWLGAADHVAPDAIETWLINAVESLAMAHLLTRHEGADEEMKQAA